MNEPHPPPRPEPSPNVMPDDEPMGLVIPCYNEAQRWVDAPLLRYASGVTYPLAILLVDDGSTDATADLLAATSDRLQRVWRERGEEPGRTVEVMRLERNCGKGEAVRQGMLRLLRRAQTPVWVAYWDADWATPLEDLARFRQVLRDQPACHWVYGSRVPFALRRRGHPVRAGLGAVCAWLTHGILGERIEDTQCGAKLLRVSPLLHALIEQPFQARWMFDVEILVRTQRWVRQHPEFFPNPPSPRLKDLLAVVPVSQWSDCPGSKIRWWDYPRALWDLIRMASPP